MLGKQKKQESEYISKAPSSVDRLARLLDTALLQQTMIPSTLIARRSMMMMRVRDAALRKLKQIGQAKPMGNNR